MESGDLDRARAGDRDALDALILRELPALRAFVRANVPADLRARESCSDLVQSVCREVVQDNGFYEDRGPEAFRAWLFRWALHKIRDRARYYRAEKRAPGREIDLDQSELAQLYGSIRSPSAGAIAREDVELLERALDDLGDEDRLVIGMCRLAGLPREQVARALGTSPGAVRTRLSRALVRLGIVLQQLGARPEDA